MKKNTLKEGTVKHKILALLMKHDSVKKCDIITCACEGLDEDGKKIMVNSFSFGDGMLGLKKKGWVEKASVHGYWKITESGVGVIARMELNK